MPNTDLNLQLKLQDQASKGIDSFTKGLAKTVAAVFSLKKAWDAINIGANIEQQKTSFNSLGDTYGFNADRIISKMKEAADGTITSFDLMKNASRALTLGIQADALPELLEISRKAARVMGEDAQFMFQSITLGIGRQSKLILDNLGIIIDADNAYKDYAQTLGITADKLTEAQKKQAFLNEAIKQGKEKFREINLEQLTAKERIEKLTTGFKELSDQIFQAAANSGLLQKGLDALNKVFKKANDSFGDISPLEKNANAINALEKEYEELLRVQELVEKQGFSIYKDKTLERRINSVTNSLGDLIDEHERLFNEDRELGIDKAIKRSQVLFEISLKEKEDAILKTEEALYQAEEAMQEMAERTASGMVNSFGNIFFDGMKNDLQSLASYAKSWGNYMLRVLSEVIAKQMVSNMLMGAVSSFGLDSSAGMGKFLTTAATSLTGKQTGGYIPETGAYQLHKGETVVPAHESGGGGGTTIVNNFISPPPGVDAGQIAAIITSDIRSRGSISQAIRSNI